MSNLMFHNSQDLDTSVRIDFNLTDLKRSGKTAMDVELPPHVVDTLNITRSHLSSALEEKYSDIMAKYAKLKRVPMLGEITYDINVKIGNCAYNHTRIRTGLKDGVPLKSIIDHIAYIIPEKLSSGSAKEPDCSIYIECLNLMTNRSMPIPGFQAELTKLGAKGSSDNQLLSLQSITSEATSASASASASSSTPALETSKAISSSQLQPHKPNRPKSACIANPLPRETTLRIIPKSLPLEQAPSCMLHMPHPPALLSSARQEVVGHRNSELEPIQHSRHQQTRTHSAHHFFRSHQVALVPNSSVLSLTLTHKKKE
jgi:hypothetical protein